MTSTMTLLKELLDATYKEGFSYGRGYDAEGQEAGVDKFDYKKLLAERLTELEQENATLREDLEDSEKWCKHYYNEIYGHPRDTED